MAAFKDTGRRFFVPRRVGLNRIFWRYQAVMNHKVKQTR